MTKFPPSHELEQVRIQLDKCVASRLSPKNASDLDRYKFELCKIFVIYKNTHNVTQRALAEKISIDESLISKILHYHLEEFTTDRLIKYLSKIYSKVNLKIDVA